MTNKETGHLLTGSMIQLQASPGLKAHTKAFMERIIRTKTFNAGMDAIAQCHKTAGTKKPKSMFLVGPSGVGKSAIAHEYLSKFPPFETDTGRIQRVLYVPLTAKATVKQMLSAMLAAAHDPNPFVGNEGEMTSRLATLIKNTGIELIILDEIHHVLPEHSTAKAVTQSAADLLKSLTDRCSMPFVLVGLQESVRLLQAQKKHNAEKDQYRRRCRAPFVMDPLAIDGEEWTDTIRHYENNLGVPCITLTSDEMLARLHLASGGLHGRLSNLFEEALELSDGNTQITLDVLAVAYLNASSVFDFDKNPFSISTRVLRDYLVRFRDAA